MLLDTPSEDEDLFAQVVDDNGTLAGPGGADLAPEVLCELATPQPWQRA